MNIVSLKRKSISEDLTKSKHQKRFENVKEARNKDCTINNIINLGIPHVGEQIFSSVDTNELIQLIEVSEPWKVIIENVLLRRWNGRIYEACKDGKTEIVKILLANLKGKNPELNAKVAHGLTAFTRACKNGHKDVCQITSRSSRQQTCWKKCILLGMCKWTQRCCEIAPATFRQQKH